MITIFVLMANAGCKNKPEIDNSNPFFSQFDTPFNVPPFEKIMAKHYMPAFEKGMAEGRNGLQKILQIAARNPHFRIQLIRLTAWVHFLQKFQRSSSARHPQIQMIHFRKSRWKYHPSFLNTEMRSFSILCFLKR